MLTRFRRSLHRAQLTLEPLEGRVLLTRSIVAADPDTGQVGIAVVSFPTGVPALVPVGEPGVVVANQSVPRYVTARAVIDGIHAGLDAPTALADAVAQDPTRASRQLGVAALDPKQPSGVSVATFTGNSASNARCGLTGPTFAVQANFQTSADVCQTMADGFSKAAGSFPRRLLAALLAGTATGTDSRGEYSAVVRVYSSTWEFAYRTPVSVDANVDRSGAWAEDLTFGVHSHLAFWTRGNPADRVELTPERIKPLLATLQKLGYYGGTVGDEWTPQAEQALVAFGRRNIAFARGTVVLDDVRYIDEPLAEYVVQGYPRGVLIPATTGPGRGDPTGNDLFHTRSIAAADPATGQVGVAVVSFPTGVPSIVPVGVPGVAVANQSDPLYANAERIIAGVQEGEDAPTALAEALAQDPGRAARQIGVAALDPNAPSGVSVAAFTGSAASRERCDLTGPTFAVQANLQTTEEVCQVMADGFLKATGSFPRRLLAGLFAANPIGGDRRGEYSASLRVYAANWEFGGYTPVNVDANVDRSGDWAAELQFRVDGWLAFLTRARPEDLTELTPELSEVVLTVLVGLGYYGGDATDPWSPAAEQALARFAGRNLWFARPTVVVDGTRYIDEPLANYMGNGYPRGVLRPAPGSAPGGPGPDASLAAVVAVLAEYAASGQELWPGPGRRPRRA